MYIRSSDQWLETLPFLLQCLWLFASRMSPLSRRFWHIHVSDQQVVVDSCVEQADHTAITSMTAITLLLFPRQLQIIIFKPIDTHRNLIHSHKCRQHVEGSKSAWFQHVLVKGSPGEFMVPAVQVNSWCQDGSSRSSLLTLSASPIHLTLPHMRDVAHPQRSITPVRTCTWTLSPPHHPPPHHIGEVLAPGAGGAGNIAPVYPYPFLLVTTTHYD